MKKPTLSVLVALAGLALSPASLQAQTAKGFAPDALPESWPTRDAATADAKKKSPAIRDVAALKKLLADSSVTLIKAHRVFVPGRGGKAATLSDGSKAWLALRSGKLVGLYAEPAQKVEIPRDEIRARMLDFTKDRTSSFAMPGMVDADSRWFRSTNDLQDRSANAGVDAADDLETWQEGWEELPRESGVTTVFVPAAVSSQTSGSGALVSLDLERGVRVQSKRGALYYRLTTTATSGSNLTRRSVSKALKSSLEGAKKYEEAKKKAAKALKEYKKKRKEFLAHYKKNPLKPGQKVESEAPRRSGRPSRGGRRMGRRLTKEMIDRIVERLPPAQREAMRKRLEARLKEQQDREKAQAKPAEPKKEDKKPAKPTAKKAPSKPKYPKRFKKNAGTEALLQVLAGKRVLRVEAHRKDEILALLEVAKEHKLKKLVLVGGTEAWKVAAELRLANVTVVLSQSAVPTRNYDTLEEHWASSAAKLAEAGVRVAFGSAGTRTGRWLPMQAARAVARGMPTHQALQSLTNNGLHAAGLTKGDTGYVVFTDSPLAPTAKVVCIAQNRGVQMIEEKK